MWRAHAALGYATHHLNATYATPLLALLLCAFVNNIHAVSGQLLQTPSDGSKVAAWRMASASPLGRGVALAGAALHLFACASVCVACHAARQAGAATRRLAALLLLMHWPLPSPSAVWDVASHRWAYVPAGGGVGVAAEEGAEGARELLQRFAAHVGVERAPAFSAGGVMAVDLPLLVGYCAALATYTVVVQQFHEALFRAHCP